VEANRPNPGEFVVASVVAVVMIVWAGARLALLVTGGGGPVPLEAAGAALRQLPADVGDPAGAWPAPWSSQLPGAVVYWSCTAVVAALAVLLAAVVVTIVGRRRVGTVRRRPLGVDARPRFGRWWSLAPLLVLRAPRSRFVVARLGPWLVATEDARSSSARWWLGRRRGDRGAVALVGPSRSGKTTAAVGAILEWDGPAVLASVKADLLGSTAGWRATLGQVRVYDPTGSTGNPTRTESRVKGDQPAGDQKASDEGGENQTVSNGRAETWPGDLRGGPARVGAVELVRATWSPLAKAGSIAGAQRAARALCEAAPRGGVEGGLDFWLAQAEILLSGLLFVAAGSHGHMGSVAEWVLTQDRPGELGPGVVRSMLDALACSEDAAIARDATYAEQALVAVWEMDDRTRASVYATAQTVVWPWADPGVAASACGASIDLEWLLTPHTPDDPSPREQLAEQANVSADGQTAEQRAVDADGSAVQVRGAGAEGSGGGNTLYLCAPIEDQRRLAPAFGGLLNDLINQVYRHVARTGKPLDPPLLVVIDEAGNTPLRALPEYASTLAGLGVLLVTIWQSLAQIQAAYDRQADTILTNHLTKLFYAGLSDTASLRYVQEVLGEAEINSSSLSGVKRLGGAGSEQWSTTRVPLAPAHALRQMRPGDALLVHGTLPPAHVRTRPFYRSRSLAARAARPFTLDVPPDPTAAPGDEAGVAGAAGAAGAGGSVSVAPAGDGEGGS
jgi:type IV secretion system protein VirD4